MGLKLEIVTAESPVFSGEVDAIIAPGIMGQFTVLPHHAALMTMLEPGELILRIAGQETFMAVSGGYLEVLDEKVIVLADAAEHADEIDSARAEAAMKRAQEQMKRPLSAGESAAAEAALRRSLARLRVSERRKKRRGDRVI